jgi:hypothetical protein
MRVVASRLFSLAGGRAAQIRIEGQDNLTRHAVRLDNFISPAASSTSVHISSTKDRQSQNHHEI